MKKIFQGGQDGRQHQRKGTVTISIYSIIHGTHLLWAVIQILLVILSEFKQINQLIIEVS